ncbi:MAG: SMP-30/gluconolactonase/LRE family protein [Planctomycetota bacterium]|jgi:outer membrane protein assembly factor BamB
MTDKLHRNPHHPKLYPALAAVICLAVGLPLQSGFAVNSKITKHATAADLAKGQVKDVVVGSKGTLRLGRAWETPIEQFDDVWSINSIIVNGGTIYIGTSPNGGIFKYSLGQLTKIYPPQSEEKEKTEANDRHLAALAALDANEPNDAEILEADEYLANEHIFAMATDMAGRLLAGISGAKCRLVRFSEDIPETIFEPEDAKYIFAIATDERGNIYLGTGPEGKVYKIDPFNPADPAVLYDSLDKNVLSLSVAPDGFLFAGTDSRGLVYRIDPRTKTATVLYDSDQPEITALLLGPQNTLYAAATSAEMAKAEKKFAARSSLAGRPEVKPLNKKNLQNTKGGRTLKIANTKESAAAKTPQKKTPTRKPPRPRKASFIYKITKDGYVTDIFSQAVVLFSLAAQDGNLLIGTGNSAQLFAVDPAAEQQAVIYEDDQASQITAVAVAGEDLYLGTANPAKLIKLGTKFAARGTYTSDLIDADQPAKWGKLQAEADIPPGCMIMLASRSGNVKDINDPTFSEWTEPVEITGPVQLRCPLGRFCQYKLILHSDDGSKSPLVREIAVASTVPNLAPTVEAVGVEPITGQTGKFKISFKAKDHNNDKLIYKIDFRKLGRANWIQLKDELETDSHEWDGRTVEDGRYEVRITADDRKSNTTATKMTGTRVSDPIIIDNTGPDIKEHRIKKEPKTVTLKLRVLDEFSAIERLNYTVDSNDEWRGTMPDDLVYDTTEENFTILIEDLEPGEHIIAIRVRDHAHNITYKTFEVDVPG